MSISHGYSRIIEMCVWHHHDQHHHHYHDDDDDHHHHHENQDDDDDDEVITENQCRCMCLPWERRDQSAR